MNNQGSYYYDESYNDNNISISLSSSSSCFNLESLPSDLKQQIACYLSGKDAISLSLTCQTIHQDLDLSVTFPMMTIIESAHWYGSYLHGDIPQRGPKIPIISQNNVHSIALKGKWQDQGWGNQKGQLYIVAFDHNTTLATTATNKQSENNNSTSSNDNTESEFSSTAPIQLGHILWESNIAQHDLEEFWIHFSPLATKTKNTYDSNNEENQYEYYLYYKVGGGGGHELIVQNLQLQATVFGSINSDFVSSFEDSNNSNFFSNLHGNNQTFAINQRVSRMHNVLMAERQQRIRAVMRHQQQQQRQEQQRYEFFRFVIVSIVLYFIAQSFCI